MTVTTNEAVQTETVEVVKVDLLASRTRINPTAPESNRFFRDGLTIYVTQNEEGRIRTAMVDGNAGYKIGDTFVAKKYGTLTVIGRRAANGRKAGQVPDEKLPMRVFSLKA